MRSINFPGVPFEILVDKFVRLDAVKNEIQQLVEYTPMTDEEADQLGKLYVRAAEEQDRIADTLANEEDGAWKAISPIGMTRH